jgi:hypothetical protein
MGSPSTDLIQMDTPRPTLDTLHYSNRIASRREKVWNLRVRHLLAIPQNEEVIIRNVLAKHRRRQTRRLGSRDEDPDPYDRTYIFYCLQGQRED